MAGYKRRSTIATEVVAVARKHTHTIRLDQQLAARPSCLISLIQCLPSGGSSAREASWGSMNLSGGTRDIVTWKPVAGAHDARHRAERKAPMLEFNYESGVPPWRVWPSCSSARSSTFLIAASFSESLIFRRSRRRIIPPKRNMAPSMIADAAMR